VKNTFPFILVIASALLLFASSCSEDCEPVDVDALNSIYLDFDTGTDANSFDPSELDSIYMIRYQIGFFDSFNFPVDTITLFDKGVNAPDYRLRIGRESPSGIATGPPYYTQYAYRFFSYGEDWQVRLQSIEVDGGYIDTDNCEYETRLKSYVLNDDTLIRTGQTSYKSVFKD